MKLTRYDMPPGLVDYARHIAAARVQANRDFYKGTHRERGGNRHSGVFGILDNATYVDAIGILGECCVRHLLDVNPKVWGFLSSTAVKGSNRVDSDTDIIAYPDTGGVRNISVKATESSVLKANCKTFRKERAEHVAFVILRRDHFHVAWVKRKDVLEWDVNDDHYSPYFECRINLNGGTP